MKLVVETGAHAPHRITILFGEQDVNNQKRPPNMVKMVSGSASRTGRFLCIWQRRGEL